MSARMKLAMATACMTAAAIAGMAISFIWLIWSLGSLVAWQTLGTSLVLAASFGIVTLIVSE